MSYHTLFIVLLVVFQRTIAQDKIRPFPHCWDMNYTTAGIYDYETQKCCLGTIHANIKPDYQKCCGAKVYDSSKQLCCNGNIFNMTCGALACCGNKTINTDRSICCENQKVDIPKTNKLISYARCCGSNRYYDSRTQTCCITEKGVKVVNGAKKPCCGLQVYNESKEVCCVSFKNNVADYNVVPRCGDKTYCCGKTLIDPYTEHCCNDQVVKLDGCCGSTAYNTSTHICCDNKDPVNKQDRNIQCCGEEAYDTDCYVCCYDSSSQSVKLIRKTNPNQQYCCGLNLYDPLKQICCYPAENIIVKQNDGDTGCCGNLSFNYATYQCCGGELFDYRSGYCCGDSEMYHPETQICCTKYSDNGTLEGHAIANNPDYKLGCCGMKPYDYSKQMCCGNTLFPISRNTVCCGEHMYDYNKEICCYDTVFTKQCNQDTCCFYGTTDEKPECPIYYANQKEKPVA